jgi:hypothetical protein
MTLVAETDLTREAPPTRARRVAAACAVLLVAYVALSLLNDPHGYLGTDTGGKVATLRAMEQGRTLDPDVGYWAEQWDPDGRLHPLFYTWKLGDKWVNVTTLPALYVGYPLFRLAGYRGALLVPMLGSVLAALAARALARRLRPGDERTGWLAFWLVGLASPLTVYALDFWEHSLGVALLSWAVVLLYDLVEDRAGWKAAAGAGLLVGAAATMRTEALIYGAVATAVTCLVVLLRRRTRLPPLVVGLAVVAGLAVPLVANQALERATIGSVLRADRAAGTVRAATDAGADRAAEAVITAVSLDGSESVPSYLVGATLLGLLMAFAVRASQGTAADRAARMAAVGAGALYLIRATRGLAFVPGLVATTPVAVVGLTLGWRRRGPGDGRSVDGTRFLLAIALLALPLVWAFQFTGGAGPQWGGRYILPSGLLLLVVGVKCLPLIAGWARTTIIVMAAAVTCFGLAWLSVRSHGVANAAEALSRRPEPVLVSRNAHLVREGGWYAGDKRWLTAQGNADLAEAIRVVTEAGVPSFGLVAYVDDPDPGDFPGWARTSVFTVPYLIGDVFQVTTYIRTSHAP